MVECSFCGKLIKPGTGILYVKKDGTLLVFCSRKCEKRAFNASKDEYQPALYHYRCSRPEIP